MVTGYFPKTQKEALAQKRKFQNILLITGGTDAMVQKKEAEHVIFLNQVKEFLEIREDETTLSIGAAVTYSQLLEAAIIPEILKQAIREIALPAIRNAGTLAGNICNASPAGDSLPVLYVLDALVVKAHLLASGEIEEEKVPIEEFIQGVRKIALKEDEIVTRIEIPKRAYEKSYVWYYQKVGARESEAIAKLSFVGAKKWNNGSLEDIKIAFGSVFITVIRDQAFEKTLKKKKKEELEELTEAIVAYYEDKIRPIDDQRSSAVYRKKVCLNLLRDFLKEQAGEKKEE